MACHTTQGEGGKRRGSQTIEGEEHWVEYNQCCVELCKIALICVHKEEKASAELTEGTSQLSILCVRPLLERDSTGTLDVKHFHLPKLSTSVVAQPEIQATD